MAPYLLILIFLMMLSSPVWGLQVTPDSECASFCTDYYGADPSDSNASNTRRSDVVCNDSDYSNTVAGLKYRSCLDCLQSSKATAPGESDQAWFLYNVRYTINVCLFSETNKTDQTKSSCASDSVCNPLRVALETGIRAPTKANEFSYCDVDDGGIGFLSSYLTTCQQCLQQSADNYYLSNFLAALDAGCTQKPADGTVLGLDGSLFSKTQMRPIAAASPHHDILTKGSISGIIIGGIAGVFVILLCIYVCMKKHRKIQNLQRPRSPFQPPTKAANSPTPPGQAYPPTEISPSMGLAYEMQQILPAVEAKPVQTSCAPFVRNFSMRNFGMTMHVQEKLATRRIDTKRALQTPDSFSPGPSLYSPQTPCQDFPTHYAYVQPTLPSIRELSNLHGASPQPLTSNPLEPTQSIPLPSRVRFSRFCIPRVSTTQSPRPSHYTKTPTKMASTWATIPVHEHPADSQISAPIMSIEPRFKSEEDVKEASETLHRGGVSASSVRRKWQGSFEVKSPERSSPRSASTAVSIEMWPGSF